MRLPPQKPPAEQRRGDVDRGRDYGLDHDRDRARDHDLYRVPDLGHVLTASLSQNAMTVWAAMMAPPTSTATSRNQKQHFENN